MRHDGSLGNLLMVLYCQPFEPVEFLILYLALHAPICGRILCTCMPFGVFIPRDDDLVEGHQRQIIIFYLFIC
jgi:hypothetical protein